MGGGNQLLEQQMETEEEGHNPIPIHKNKEDSELILGDELKYNSDCSMCLPILQFTSVVRIREFVHPEQISGCWEPGRDIARHWTGRTMHSGEEGSAQLLDFI
jgi:hypothetical protein